MILLGFALCGTAFAQDDAGPTNMDLKVMADTVWVLIAGFLVFWMNAGFGFVEAGLCRAKNAVNILGKNFVVFGLASLAFWIVGFAIMFGDGNAFMGLNGWLLGGADNSPLMGDDYAGVFSSLNWTSVPLLAKFFFQLAFAATAATIVSGCVAERIHYKAYILFTLILVGLSYPITGHWIWGGGWLGSMGFRDFAGSTVVHSVGGWAGLAGIFLLGPRLGKYKADGKVQPIQGHSMAMVFLGGLILWLGWFGFNPGSTMAVDPDAISMIVVTTNMACAASLLSATIVSWLWLGSPDFTMTVNGALAGLVAVTAPCAFVTVEGSVIIGLIAGIIVVPAVLMFDSLRIDDPVGALSVHLVNGIWGTLAIGLFATDGGLFYGGGFESLQTQLIGVVAVGAFTLIVSFAAWFLVKMVFGLRVSETEEREGLDLSEMGIPAYGRDALMD
ncbi:MAG: ammonium transporter [Acidobacteria bacterium]|nr:ammonium transporter [Acidobacteriota bacterium]MDA1236026.1 ammonium transporter [Acidobacteriota bacterium]